MRAVEPPRGLAPSLVIGDSASMRAVFALLTKIAGADVPVLITGETGTGKSLFAHALHALGPRHRGPLHIVECARSTNEALAPQLLGGIDEVGVVRPGLLDERRPGLLLLEEIGELPAPLQARLLTLLERGTAAATAVGNDNGPRTLRVVATTRRDLPAMVARGEFNKGLYYALDVVTLSLPPLRDRAEDIPGLARSLLTQLRERYPQTAVERLSEDAMQALVAHAFPGNVRELVHVLERAVLCGLGPEVSRAELPREVWPGHEVGK
jgi:two-component system, NtrC family, response regulator AtoC